MPVIRKHLHTVPKSPFIFTASYIITASACQMKGADSMKYLKSFTIILFLSFLGDILHELLPLPVPAGIYGILILFLCLELKIIPVSAVKAAGSFLIEIMPVMFIPAAVGLLDAWPSLQPVWLPVILITVITTVLVMAVTGRITQHLIRKEKRNEKHSD